jgi:hypothetical protein
MQIAAVVARLQTVTDLNKRVEIAADIAQLMAELTPAKSPWAWVISPGDNATPNQLMTGGIRQKVTDRYGVVLACRDVSDRRGEAALIAVEALFTAVEAALLGYVPAAGYAPIEYESGRMAGGSDGWVLWLHIWQSHHYIWSSSG